MSVMQWTEERTNAMTVWDVGVLKVLCVFFGLIIGAYVPSFVTQNIWWFVAVVLLLGGRSGYRWLMAESH